MEWKNIKNEIPDNDITFLAWCNGEVYLANRYRDLIINAQTLEKLDIQYWCEITPPTKNLL